MPPKGTGRFTRRPSATEDIPRDDRPSPPTPTPAPDAPAAAEEPTLERVSFYLNPDKTIAWERMRESTRETLRSVLGQSAPGAPGAVPAMAIDPLMSDYLWHAIGVLAVNVAYATGHTVESSRELLFTDQEKAAFRELTTRVLNKHAALLGKWQEELALGAMVLVTVQGKISKLEKRPKSAPHDTRVTG